MIIAIITARGGSKGLPKKNIKIFDGLPLIAHTIKAAQESLIFDKILVTTDSQEIANIASKYNAEVLIRPKNLAQDDTSSYEVVEHLLKNITCNTFVLLQPTSPLRRSTHIIEAFNAFCHNGFTSLVSITETSDNPFKCIIEDKATNSFKPLFSWDSLTQPRQHHPNSYIINGAIYICKTECFLNEKSFFTKKIGFYRMNKISSIDIDNIEDFNLAEVYCKNS